MLDKNKVAARLAEIRAQGGLRREAGLGEVDTVARTVELSFSSEAAEVPRWFGLEVLSHATGAVDLSRLNDGAAVLWMHDWGDQRGVVESARIDADRVGRAVVRFSRSPAGEQLMRDVADRIITKVSVGYIVNGMRLREERAGDDVYLITEWQPYEISFVSVPADASVGVGRISETPGPGHVHAPPSPGPSPSLPWENPREEPRPALAQGRSLRSSEGSICMNEKILRDGSGNLVRAKVDENGAIIEILEVIERAGAEAQAAQQRGQEAERSRVRALTELGNSYGATDLALRCIAEGKAPDDMQRELLAKYAQQRAAKPMAEQVREAEVGLTDREVRNYSLMRAVRALANPLNAGFQKDAAFEFECSRAATDKLGKESRGIMIPADVLNRAFSTTTPASGAGSNIVAQSLLSDSFIELLRNKTWALKRVTAMGGLVGNVDIPRQTDATQAYWVGEGGAPSDSAPALDQIHFTPKSMAAFTDITRRLMMQATPDAELIVRNDLLRVMALAVDKAVLYATGSGGQPKGLLYQTGIHAVQLAEVNPSYQEFVQMETDIAAANADVDGMAYVINARARGAAKTTLKFPGVNGSATIWEQGNTINGYAVETTNQIENGDVWFGNWADYIVAMWGGLDMMVDPYSLSTSGGTRIVVFQDVDLNIRRIGSFTYANKAATAAA